MEYRRGRIAEACHGQIWIGSFSGTVEPAQESFNACFRSVSTDRALRGPMLNDRWLVGIAARIIKRARFVHCTIGELNDDELRKLIFEGFSAAASKYLIALK